MSAEAEVHGGTQVAKAQARAERIRSHLADAAQEYAAAIIEEDWRTLGFDGIEVWRETMFAGHRLNVETRRQVHELLNAEGMSPKAIAPATGTPHRTVQRDLEAPRHSGAGTPDQAGPSRNVTPGKPKKKPKTAAERQAARRERERRAGDKQLADQVRQYIEYAGLADIPEEDQVTSAVRATAEAATAPPPSAEAKISGLERQLQVQRDLRAQLETELEEKDAGLTEENTRLQEQLADATRRLETTHVAALEKQLADATKEISRLKGSGKTPDGKLARPCTAHARSAGNIAQCPNCGQA